MLNELEYIVERLIENKLLFAQYEDVMNTLYDMSDEEIEHMYEILEVVIQYDFNDITEIRLDINCMDSIADFNDAILTKHIQD